MPIIKRFEHKKQRNQIDKIIAPINQSILDSFDKEVIKTKKDKINKYSFFQKWKKFFKSIFHVNK